MFKIEKIGPNKFDVSCYQSDEDGAFNTFLYSVSNITEDAVAALLQGRSAEQPDVDFAIEVAGSNGPAYLTDEGDFIAAPVRVPRSYDNVRTRKVLQDS